jgi:hypothetical protein
MSPEEMGAMSQGRTVFEIAFAGGDKDGNHYWFYQDLHGRLCFFAELSRKPVINWSITGAMTGVRCGLPFWTSQNNEAIIRQNIEFFFKTRAWTTPVRPGDESTAKTPVTFSWKIGRVNCAGRLLLTSRRPRKRVRAGQYSRVS